MRLTTKGRYAVTAMLDLVIHQHKGAIALAAISKRQDISLSYLEQLFAKLRKHKLVTSFRGPGGGYQLGRASEEISIGDIINAVDEIVDIRRCKGTKDCQGGEQCLPHDLWCDLSEMIQDFLGGIYLADLVSEEKKQNFVQKHADNSKISMSSVSF